MISNKTFKSLIISCFLGAFPVLIHAHEYGPDPGYTAAPGDNQQACATSGCHSLGKLNSFTGSVAIKMANGATTYTPGGAAQMITILITDAQRQSWGFQMTARVASSPTTLQAGSFTDLQGGTQGGSTSSPTPVQVICASSFFAPCPASSPLQWVEQDESGWEQSVAHPGSYSFQVLWTPPATNVGNVTLYAAGNASNSANTLNPTDSTGHIYSTNITLTPATAPSGPVPSISAGGVVSASNFGAFTSAGPGSWIEIYGTNLAASTYTWASSDFTGSAAPTTINGVKVTIGGQSCYVSYTSSGQIDAQIPANISPGSQPLIVTNANGSSSAYMLTINSAQPGFLAPPSFAVGGKQYVAAFNAALTSFILPPGAIAGVTSAYAKPGDTIIIYGVGFGPVSPSTVSDAGQIVGAVNTLSDPFTVSFGGTTAVPAYYGLAPGYVGLYQFNIVVPQIANNDFVPLTFTLAGTAGSQTLYTAVHN